MKRNKKWQHQVPQRPVDDEDEVQAPPDKLDDDEDEYVHGCARKRPPPSYEYDARDSCEEEEDIDVVDFIERRTR